MLPSGLLSPPSNLLKNLVEMRCARRGCLACNLMSCAVLQTLGGDCKSGLTCMPLTGPMSGAGLGFCTQTKELKGSAAAQELYVAQRTTMSGKACRLPLIYRCSCSSSINLLGASLAGSSD